jgi:hypothetical protein
MSVCSNATEYAILLPNTKDTLVHVGDDIIDDPLSQSSAIEMIVRSRLSPILMKGLDEIKSHELEMERDPTMHYLAPTQPPSGSCFYLFPPRKVMNMTGFVKKEGKEIEKDGVKHLATLVRYTYVVAVKQVQMSSKTEEERVFGKSS